MWITLGKKWLPSPNYFFLKLFCNQFRNFFLDLDTNFIYHSLSEILYILNFSFFEKKYLLIAPLV